MKHNKKTIMKHMPVNEKFKNQKKQISFEKKTKKTNQF